MYYDKINLFVPTKGRATTHLPQFVKLCLKACESIENLYFTFVVNEQDNATVGYLESTIPKYKLCILFEN
jgi:hypothetical protein